MWRWTIGDPTVPPQRTTRCLARGARMASVRRAWGRASHQGGASGMSPKKSNKTVGVIGLGIMGGSFSRNLRAAGWRVIGFDIDPAKRRELAKAGVEIAGSAKAVAAAAPIIITSLPKPEALAATAREIAGAKLPRRIIAECSTFTIDDKEKAEKLLRG